MSQTPGSPYVPSGSPAGQPSVGYGYGPTGFPALREHPQSTTILVLGILGMFVAVTAPFAWAMGGRARREAAQGRYAPSTSVTVGWVLGILGTLYLIAAVLGFVLFLGLVVVGARA